MRQVLCLISVVLLFAACAAAPPREAIPDKFLGDWADVKNWPLYIYQDKKGIHAIAGPHDDYKYWRPSKINSTNWIDTEELYLISQEGDTLYLLVATTPNPAIKLWGAWLHPPVYDRLKIEYSPYKDKYWHDYIRITNYSCPVDKKYRSLTPKQIWNDCLVKQPYQDGAVNYTHRVEGKRQ